MVSTDHEKWTGEKTKSEKEERDVQERWTGEEKKGMAASPQSQERKAGERKSGKKSEAMQKPQKSRKLAPASGGRAPRNPCCKLAHELKGNELKMIFWRFFGGLCF